MNWVLAAAVSIVVFAQEQASLAQTAEDRETARSLMDRGDGQVERGDIEAALASYKAAHELMHVPTTGVELARTYAKLGKLIEARDIALEVLRMPKAAKEPRPFQVARVEADELARALGPQIPALHIEVTPKNDRATLEVDGRSVPLAAVALAYALDPGEHTVRVAAEGFRPAARRVTLERGENKSIPIALEPTPPAPASATPRAFPSAATTPLPVSSQSPPPVPQRSNGTWPVWTGIGVGSAGLVVGSTAGVLSLERARAARRNCVGHTCQPAAQSDRDAALTYANVSNVAFAVAALGATLSLTSWLLSDRASQARGTNLRLDVVAAPDGGLVQMRGTLW